MPEDLSAWIGSREETEDLITSWPVAALAATLDFDDLPAKEGDLLNPLWHWLFFLSIVPQADLAPGGHARLGGFLPPVSLPRRMFAGARIEFLAPLRIGQQARRIGTVTSVEEKRGRSGPLVFVTVRYEVNTPAGPVLREEQDLVYREAPTHLERPPPGAEPLPDASWTRTITPDEALLFRFSALTFNAHRIHYDYPYVTEIVGYPHLIVHGPLIALLLADMARRHGPSPMRGFSFRAHSPLFADGPITLLGGMDGGCRAGLSAWSHDRRLAVTAHADYAEP